MLFLNLGCGWKTSDHPGVVNIDWSVMLRIRTNPIYRLFVPLLLKVLPTSWWENRRIGMGGQEVFGRMDGVEQIGGVQRGPQGAAS